MKNNFIYKDILEIIHFIMRYFKNTRHKILVTIDECNRRTVFNNGISFVAPDWYQPAYSPIEEISEDEFHYIKASGSWEGQTLKPNDASMYLYWD